MASDGDMLDEEAVEEGVDRRRWESDTARISVSKTSGSVIILALRRERIFIGGEVLKSRKDPWPTWPLIQEQLNHHHHHKYGPPSLFHTPFMDGIS